MVSVADLLRRVAEDLLGGQAQVVIPRPFACLLRYSFVDTALLSTARM